jgi:(2Fe-2S) ferredoxin
VIDACYVCVNDWCVLGGSKEFRDTLRAGLASAGSPIPVKEWDCLGFCQKAPNIVLYPQGTWFTGVQPEDMEAILVHLQGGEPSAELAARVNPKLHAILLHYLDHCFRTGLTREV